MKCVKAIRVFPARSHEQETFEGMIEFACIVINYIGLLYTRFEKEYLYKNTEPVCCQSSQQSVYTSYLCCCSLDSCNSISFHTLLGLLAVSGHFVKYLRFAGIYSILSSAPF